MYDELKSRINLSLTPTAIEGLDVLAAEREVSRSELIELVGRGKIALDQQQEGENETEFLQYSKVFKLQLAPLNQAYKLPKCPGAYIIADYQGTVYGGYCFDLKSEFRKKLLLRNLKHFFQSSTDDPEEPIEKLEEFDESLYVFWVECSDRQLLQMLKKSLIETFHKTRNELIFRSWLTQHLQNVSYQAP